MNGQADGVHTWLNAARAIALVSIVLVGGCGDGKPAGDSQIAARVNKGEISVHQLQHALERQARATRGGPVPSARTVLDSLVEQELAAQAARAEGLDHDPAVIQAMQLAQREVLAMAFQDRLASKARGSTSDEIDNYYEGHPALFEQRRLYILQETLVEAAQAESEAIAAMLPKTLGTEELADRLRAKALRFETRQFVQAAESLPLGLVLPLSQLAKGQSIALPQTGGVRVLTVLHVQSTPVDRRRAAAPIAAFLDAERRRRMVAEGMNELRKSATIELVGNFAAPAASAPGPAQQSNR